MIVLNQARYLKSAGFDVSVLTSKVSGLPDDDTFEGISIFRREFINSSAEFTKSEIDNGLKEIFFSKKPRIIHFHNGSYPAASKNMISGGKNIIHIFQFAKQYNCKIIEHSHNAQLKNPAATKQLRDLPWDCVICVSKFVKNKWLEFGSNAKKFQVIYNGIDVSKFSNVNPSEELAELKKTGKMIIFFPARVVSMSQGGISKQKNFELVLKACKRLLARNIKNFKLVAILNESERKDDTKNAFIELDDLLNKYNLGENIEFINSILPDEMPRFYAAADIVCVPSLYETFGLVYLEAMASGKIAIASNTGGPTEYIDNGIDGFLVDPENEADLSSVLEDLITGQKSFDDISIKAKEKAGEYSLEKMMSGVEEIYSKL